MSESLARLVEALALGEGFQLGLLVVPDLASADASVGALQRLLSARLGRPALLSRVSPAPDLLDPEALAAAALDPLVSLAPSDGVILDASAATARSEPAWVEVFQRLNARRNGFARQLGRALVLCLTPRLEALLAREAPDLWSVRGPRATQESPEANLPRPVEGLRYEDALASGLPDGLTRIFATPRDALPLLAELGYPPARLPLSDVADFWPQVLRTLDQGRLPGGIETLVRRLARDYGEEPGLRRAIDRLPQRVKVDGGWVNPSWRGQPGGGEDGDRLVVLPWVEELRGILRGPPGQRVAIIGRRGSGRSTGLRRALADVKRENPWLVREGRLANFELQGGSLWAEVAAIPTLRGTTWEAIAKAMQAGVRPSLEALSEIPERVRELLPKNVLAPMPAQFSHALAACLIGLSHGHLHVAQVGPLEDLKWVDSFSEIGFQRVLWRIVRGTKDEHGLTEYVSAFVIAPPYALPAVSPHVQRVIHVPPLSPEQLQALLDRRLAKASPRDQLVLRASEARAALSALCWVASTPAALLRWVSRLLQLWPMPPPPEWLEPEALARFVGSETLPPERLLALGALLDGPSQPAERVAALLGQDLRPLLATDGFAVPPLLDRDDNDPERLVLSPEADLLRPSVAAALAAHARAQQ